MTTFWKEDIQLLFRADKILEIFPSKKYDLNRKMNAIVRLSFLYTVIIYLYKKDSKVLLIPFVTMALTYLINYKKADNISYTNVLEDIISENDKNTTCRIPSKDNPFMNTNITDYGKESKVKACPSYNNVGVQNRVDELYNDGLYRDFQDVFNRNTGERQFNTMPNTQVPNDQDSYMKWLYGKPPTCKEGNSVACLVGSHASSRSTGSAV